MPPVVRRETVPGKPGARPSRQQGAAPDGEPGLGLVRLESPYGVGGEPGETRPSIWDVPLLPLEWKSPSCRGAARSVLGSWGRAPREREAASKRRCVYSTPWFRPVFSLLRIFGAPSSTRT